MYCVAAIAILGTLWGWPAGVEGVDCSDPQSLENEMTKCFGHGGLGSVEGALDEIQTNASAACSNLDVYRSGLSCAITITRKCLEAVGQNPDFLPDPQRMVDGLIYLCQNIGDYDSRCVETQQSAITQCMEEAALDDKSSTNCKAVAASLDCWEAQLSSCPGKTKEVFVNYFKYNIPPACGACAVGAPCLLLLFAALLAMACRYSDV